MCFITSCSILHLGSLDSSEELRRGILSVSLGVVLDPPPKILAGPLHGELRLPLEFLVGERGVGGEIQNVTSSPGNDLVGKFAADNGVEGLDHLEDGAAATRAQVPGLDAGLVLAEVIESDEMAPCEVNDVDVVSDGSSVTRGVVCDGQSLLL